MLHVEGMEITRGTKNIIQESIESVNYEYKRNRNVICEKFCQIVEDRYPGGTLDYQLKRMGNTYPINFLSKNNWSVKDALNNGLVVYLNNDWFSDKEYKFVNETYHSIETLAVISSDLNESTNKIIARIDVDDIVLDDLKVYNLELVRSFNELNPDNISLMQVLVPVDNTTQLLLEEKQFWLNPLISQGLENEDYNNIANLSKEQVKAMGLKLAISPSVKIPLDTTSPILDAIDKYLYDITGEYQI